MLLTAKMNATCAVSLTGDVSPCAEDQAAGA